MTKISYDSIKYDDPAVWDLICSGRTFGCFQMESYLVQDNLRKIQPRNLWELSAVIALIRPGALDSGMAAQYIENKNNPLAMKLFNNAIIDKIFASTYGVLAYQEQLMTLGTDLAWSHLPENERLLKADDLRKAVGKKDQNKILAIGKDFVEGCVANSVNQELANQLFEIIKSCGRYLFNLSHSMAYAHRAYQMAWLKYYYPLQFYTCSLNLSHEKLEPEIEVNNLVQDAKSRGITILPPNINSRNEDFRIESGDKIRFGLGYIKFVGNSLKNVVWSAEPIKCWKQWLQWVITESGLRSPAVINLIDAGAFSDLGIGRNILRFTFEFVKELKEKELAALWTKSPPPIQFLTCPPFYRIFAIP
jgi:DNA polymerase III subunit alpha